MGSSNNLNPLFWFLEVFSKCAEKAQRTSHFLMFLKIIFGSETKLFNILSLKHTLMSPVAEVELWACKQSIIVNVFFL
jgi:hypothetical protein